MLDPQDVAGGPAAPTGHEHLSVRDLLEIEVICDEFERDLRAGRSPDRRDYLARAGAANREVLRAELVALELTYRREHDSTPSEPHGANLPVEPARVTGPPFTILRELGRGGMAVVYLALDPRLGRHVALKLMREGVASPDHVRRFLAEAQAVARMRHPHIVSIFDAGESGGVPFLVLEFVEGGTLAQWAAGRVVSPLEAAVLVERLARAAHDAHGKGIVHRDIKPQNVLLALDEPGAVVPKLTDFGLAKWLDSGIEETPTGAILGTPAYMAPEQVRPDAGAIGPRTDVYALGATLYELLTGRPPFRAETPLAIASLVVAAAPVLPRKLRPDVPADLEAVCLKCLEKEPTRRYATAADLADDLARFLTGRSTRARPVGWIAAGWRAVRRRRRLIATVLGICLVAGAAFGVAWHTAPGVGPQVGRLAVEPPPLEPDPLADLLQKLKVGGEAELIGATGAPRWHRWRGMAATLGESQVGDKSVAFQTSKTTGLELAPDPQHDHYRLTAEVRHLQSFGAVGYVGLFLAGQSVECSDGTRFDRYLAVRYSDDRFRGDPADKRQFVCQDCLFVYRRGSELGVPDSETAYYPFHFQRKYQVPLGGVGTPPPWRRIVVDVSPGGVQVRLESGSAVLCQERCTKSELDAVTNSHRARVAKQFPEVARALADWSPRLPLGISVSNASVAVRNVTLKHDPPTERDNAD